MCLRWLAMMRKLYIFSPATAIFVSSIVTTIWSDAVNIFIDRQLHDARLLVCLEF